MERCNDLERFVPQHRNPTAAVSTTTNNSTRDTTILLLLLLLRFPPSPRSGEQVLPRGVFTHRVF